MHTLKVEKEAETGWIGKQKQTVKRPDQEHGHDLAAGCRWLAEGEPVLQDTTEKTGQSLGI